MTDQAAYPGPGNPAQNGADPAVMVCLCLRKLNLLNDPGADFILIWPRVIRPAINASGKDECYKCD